MPHCSSARWCGTREELQGTTVGVVTEVDERGDCCKEVFEKMRALYGGWVLHAHTEVI